MFPTGIITLLFTDIEASTRLVQLLGERYQDLLAEHHAILRQAIGAWDGLVVDTQGDAFFAVFAHAQDALAAAIASQRALAQHSWPAGLHVRVRMGLHTGEPAMTNDGYYVGLDIHRAARVCTAGHGGQVLLTQATCNLVLADLPFGISLRDLGNHRLKDLDRPERLYQIIIPELPSDFPAPRSLELFVHNLPLPLTSFIGREKESQEINRWLGHYRLVTLTGPGGTGKTRLAIRVASDLVNSFSDGVRFVELAPVADPALLPQTVAGVLGLREEPGNSILKTLSDHLRHKTMLLVLDNCEHLVDAAANLAHHLLTHCSQLKILASSREALSVTGERAYAVPTLSMPPTGSRHLLPLETLTQYEAVRLFIERAESVLPGFVVTKGNAPAIAHICYRLDGIPLAIELAAARVKTLPINLIADRLDDRFRLLAGNNQRAVPRQKTLRALIDWSYDLLSEQERILFQRLSVFVGGWSLESAESVVADETLFPAEEVLDGLDRLVNKSLIILIQEQDKTPRYLFLDTIRQYAREKLIESGEMDIIREQHLTYFLHKAQEAEPQLKGRGQILWWHWLERELDNLRAAMQWAEQQEHSNSPWLPQEHQRTERGVQLAGALWWFWFLNGYLNEAINWLHSFLDRINQEGGNLSLAYCQTVWRASCLNYFAHRWHQATHLAEQAIPLCEHYGEFDGQAIAYFVLGNVARSQQNYARAEQLYRQSYTLFQQTGNEWGIALVLNLWGWKAFFQRDYDQAEAIALQCLHLRRKIGVKVGVAAALDLLGTIARVKGDYKRAEALLQESLMTVKGLQARFTTSVTLTQLGHVALALGDNERAAALYTEALHLSHEIEDRHDILELLTHLMVLRWLQGDGDKAKQLMQDIELLSQQLGQTQSAAAMLIETAQMTYAQHDHKRAKATYEVILAYAPHLTLAERTELQASLDLLAQK